MYASFRQDGDVNDFIESLVKEHKAFPNISEFSLMILVGVSEFWDAFLLFKFNTSFLKYFYKVQYLKGMELLDFKTVLAKSLIGTYNSRCRNIPVGHVSRREVLPASVLLHLLVLQTMREEILLCKYCYTGGIENKTHIQCHNMWSFFVPNFRQ